MPSLHETVWRAAPINSTSPPTPPGTLGGEAHVRDRVLLPAQRTPTQELETPGIAAGEATPQRGLHPEDQHAIRGPGTGRCCLGSAYIPAEFGTRPCPHRAP